MMMCEFLKDQERRRKQTPVSHTAGNKLSVFQQVPSQVRIVYAMLVKGKVSTATW